MANYRIVVARRLENGWVKVEESAGWVEPHSAIDEYEKMKANFPGHRVQLWDCTRLYMQHLPV